jgi:hypothetical protein
MIGGYGLCALFHILNRSIFHTVRIDLPEGASDCDACYGKLVKRGRVFSSSFLSSYLKAIFVFFWFWFFGNLARLLWQCSGVADLA